MHEPSPSKEPAETTLPETPLLFTPGPLTTSPTVKQAMLRDLGSRDDAFIHTVREIRRRLVALAAVDPEQYTAVIMQGSGTFGIEAVLGTAVPRQGKLLVVVNGAYGRRMVQMAKVLEIATVVLETPENRKPDLAAVQAALDADPAVSHVAVVHCETTTGIINPVEEIGRVVAARGKGYIVDAMSSFGAVPLAMGAAGIDYLISSANKCIQGVPGFSFVIARRDALLATQGNARSLSLDLLGQYKGLEGNGQFRFTPPTHALLAFHQALLELEEEGGVAARAVRYQANHQVIAQGMARLGFTPYLPPTEQGHIITSFRYPDHPRFDFEHFYDLLSRHNMLIYPGKVSDADCFRIGHIGHLFPADMEALLTAVAAVLDDMDIQLLND